MDLVGIKPGEDFRKIISDRVGAADVALVVIGRKWLNAKGPRGRRLDDRDDFVLWGARMLFSCRKAVFVDQSAESISTLDVG